MKSGRRDFIHSQFHAKSKNIILCGAKIGMTNLGAKVFLDTNVVLRATIDRVELHTEAQRLVDSQHDAGKELWISRQVIREYMAFVTRPHLFFTPMNIEEVEELVKNLQSLFHIADETAAVTARLLQLIKQ